MDNGKLPSRLARELLAAGVPAAEVARRTGLTPQGVHRASIRGAKVDQSASEMARALLASGLSPAEVARRTGLSRQGVHGAARGVNRLGVTATTTHVRVVISLPSATRRKLQQLCRLRAVRTMTGMVCILIDESRDVSTLPTPVRRARGVRTEMSLPIAIAGLLDAMVVRCACSRGDVIRALVEIAA